MATPRQNQAITQTETIKAHLLTGATISTWDAYERYQITCLAQRVHDIRRSSLNVKSEIMVENGKRFSLYWVEEQERARYASGKVNTPADVRGTGGDTREGYNSLASINEATKSHRAKHDALAAVNANNGVWMPHSYIDDFLSALTLNAKSLNLLAQISYIEGTAEADKINDYSMEVSDIAMSLTLATSDTRPQHNRPSVSGTWLAQDYLKQLKLSIEGNANGLGTMAITAKLTNTDLNDGVNEASMRLAEISANIEEVLILTDMVTNIEGSISHDK